MKTKRTRKTCPISIYKSGPNGRSKATEKLSTFDVFNEESYQVRMLATTILGRLAIKNNDALCFLKQQISTDKNWQLQEILAKAFDGVCKYRGYEASLPLITITALLIEH